MIASLVVVLHTSRRQKAKVQCKIWRRAPFALVDESPDARRPEPRTGGKSRRCVNGGAFGLNLLNSWKWWVMRPGLC